MLKLMLLKGLPGSGKSTIARELISSDDSWKRVNRDDIRNMLGLPGGQSSTSKFEKAVKELELNATKQFLIAGYNVVVDDTNLRSETRRAFHDIAKAVGNVLVLEKFVDTPYETCLQRNSLRSGVFRVPDNVIFKMAKNVGLLGGGSLPSTETFYERIPPRVQNNHLSLPKAVICDLDGTLALITNRSPFDTASCDSDVVNDAVLQCISSMIRCGRMILFITGRERKFERLTRSFIDAAFVSVFGKSKIDYELYMRENGDTRQDAKVKKEIFDRYVNNRYFVDFVLEDRDRVVQMWRDIGLSTFQVNWGSF